MNAKENALRIIQFDHPERVAGGCPTHGVGYRGCNHEGYEGGGHHLPVGSVWTDIWGTEWHREHDDVMGFPRGNPLADLPAALERFTWPDPDDERIIGPIYEKAKSWKKEETFLCGSHRDTLWEKCYMLVGMENAMCFFHTEPEAMREVLHRIMDFQLGIAQHYLKVGVEMVNLSDDLGTQCGLLLSPELMNDFLVPEYRRLFALYKPRKVLVNFHSCGHIEPVLDLFMDLGVDILNPLQATSNDLAAVRRKTAGRMALQGGIASGLIASGPPSAIREEVRRRIWELGRDGGYFCGPDQWMPCPESHMQALRDAVNEFGHCPLPLPPVLQVSGNRGSQVMTSEAPPQTEGHVGPPLVGVLLLRPSTSEGPTKNVTHSHTICPGKDSSSDKSLYRERFACTLAHQPVDRPPMDLASTDMTQIEGGPRRLAPALGLAPSGSDAETDEAVLRALDTDIRGVGGLLFPPSPLARRVSPTEVVNCWGITSQWNGHHYEMVGHPLAGKSIDDLARYPWPDPDAISRAAMADLARRAEFLNRETPYVVCGRHPYYGVMELGCWMCGFDDFLYRMAAEPEFVRRFFGIIAEYQRRVDAVYYGAIGRHIHFTTSGDDFGTQIAPFISPAMFHDLVRPYLEARIRHIRLFTDAAFFHHSCGAIAPLIPDLIDAGVTILNPIQPRAVDMEPERLKADFGSRLTFYGGVDTQELLPKGMPEQVAAETRKLIRIMGADGSYILSAAHTFQEDVPVANIIAMYRAGKKG